MKRTQLMTGLLAVMVLLLSACAAPAAPGATGGEASDGEALTCTDEIGCIEVLADDPISVGGMLTISGPTAFLGEDSKGGVEIALEEKGELFGHELEFVLEDSLCNAEGGQTTAQKVASNPNIVGVIGTNCSGAAAAALPILSEAGLSMISSSNTSPALTNDDPETGGIWMPGYYRTGHNDNFQGAVAARFALEELGLASAATIHDGDPYTEGLQRVFADSFAELGGEVKFQGAVNKGDTDMRPILTEIATDPPDILYFPLFEPESNFIAAQVKEIPGLEDTILMSADGSLVDSFPENTGDAAGGMYLSGPYLSGDTYQEFLSKWEAKYGGTPPSGFHAHAYDATNILLQAIEEVAQEGDDGTILIGRQALRDALSSTADFQGLTGVLACSSTGDCATGEALGIFQITEAEVNDGNWPPEVVWTP